MAKRGVGDRGKVLFDSIDLQILVLLDNHQLPLGIIDIAQRLKLTHKNLKPHIDKLISLRLISLLRTLDLNKTNKTRITTRSVILHAKLENNEITDDELKEGDKIEGLMKYLKEADRYFFNKETLKRISLDLRKLKTQKELLNDNNQATHKKKDTP